jgi:DNA-binding NarL/FixJ family response regulator
MDEYIKQPKQGIKRREDVLGKWNEIDTFHDTRIKAKTEILSSQEKIVLDFVINKGYTLSATARRMRISQPMVTKYWKRIQEKMK